LSLKNFLQKILRKKSVVQLVAHFVTAIEVVTHFLMIQKFAPNKYNLQTKGSNTLAFCHCW
jgi:hypothetical protein